MYDDKLRRLGYEDVTHTGTARKASGSWRETSTHTFVGRRGEQWFEMTLLWTDDPYDGPPSEDIEERPIMETAARCAAAGRSPRTS
ncbi:MAG TPA: hypothetical protein VFT22_27595 [Kofleriaceae bacterium]|nr:hypothetical protein [Kofleriaceae bacterium]